MDVVGDGGFAISFISGMLHLDAILTARYHLASLRGRFEVCGIYFINDKEIARQDRCYLVMQRLLFIVLQF